MLYLIHRHGVSCDIQALERNAYLARGGDLGWCLASAEGFPNTGEPARPEAMLSSEGQKAPRLKLAGPLTPSYFVKTYSTDSIFIYL